MAALRRLKGAQRAMVVVRGPQGPQVRQLHGPMDPAELADPSSPAGFTLHRVLEKNVALFSPDITQDPAFAGCARRSEGRSVLCVPVPGGSGYLYADHSLQAGAFSHADLRAVEALANSLGVPLEQALRQPAGSSAAADDHNLLKAAGAVVLVALAWGAVGVITHSRPLPPPPPPPTMAQLGPQSVVASYLALVRLGQWKRAHRLLARSNQARVDAATFQARGQKWLGADSHRWELDYRRPGAVVVTGNRAHVTVTAPPGGATWTFELVKAGGGWALERWTGGPLSPADAANTPAPPG